MKIQVTELVTQCFTIEVPDTLNSYDEIDAEVERQRTTRDDIKRDTAVSGVEWGQQIGSNEDVAKNLELFKPTYLWIPNSAVDDLERMAWNLYMNGFYLTSDGTYDYRHWRETGEPSHHPKEVLAQILKERGE